MTAISPGNLACVLAGILLCAGIVRAQEGGDLDLRDLRVGMSIAAIPPGEYVDLTCVETHDQTLAEWSDFHKCPRDSSGLRSVGFRFNDRLNALAQVNEKYQGTKVAGHPVVLTALIDEGGTIDGLRIDTDPQARLFWRKKAHLLALVVKSRYGEEAWECHNIEPSGGETAVGGLFTKEHCEKIAGHRRLLLDRRLYRRPGQSMNDFVNETHVEIRRADGAR
jgi:hypothetical protein